MGRIVGFVTGDLVDMTLNVTTAGTLNDELWHGKDGVISTPDSAVKVVVTLTDEEYMIARDTEAIVEGL